MTDRSLTSLQSGLLTLGYLIAIIATIRVGEKLLQRFGPRRPMIWGCIITGCGILMCSMTFVFVAQYVLLAFTGFTLFGIGLGIYATPSTDAALSNVPEDKVGAASGLDKMASSLGNAIGVAISAALYVAAQTVAPAFIQTLGLFVGNQHNPAGLRQLTPATCADPPNRGWRAQSLRAMKRDRSSVKLGGALETLEGEGCRPAVANARVERGGCGRAAHSPGRSSRSCWRYPSSRDSGGVEASTVSIVWFNAIGGSRRR